jgi:hypothetical protein
MNQEEYTYTFEDAATIIEFFDELNYHSDLFTSVVRNPTRISFCVNCNDLFFWACADGEPVLASDMPAIRTALADVRDLIPDDPRQYYYSIGTALSLWVSRKRGMRPQGCCYPKQKALWPLFDACGPERESGAGCNNKRPNE